MALLLSCSRGLWCSGTSAGKLLPNGDLLSGDLCVRPATRGFWVPVAGRGPVGSLAGSYMLYLGWDTSWLYLGL